LFHQTELALFACILFGLIGAAPAGVIMALTSEAIRPANRAFGMGLFFSSYFLLVAPAPVIAGWLVDQNSSNWPALLFAAGLFAATGASYAGFRLAQRSLAAS
jgi:MFS family permease